MADVNIQLGYKDSAWFTANASIVLDPGQIVYLEQTGTYKLGDGVTALSALAFLGGGSGSSTWGGITGTLSDQTDLQTALNNKEPLKGTDDNYVTDAQLVVIGNTSGTNSGDNATNSTSNTYADGKVADSITNGVTTIAPSQNAVFDAFDNLNIFTLVGLNSSISPADSTYYFGAFAQGVTWQTTSVTRATFFSKALTLRKVVMHIVQVGNPSGEIVTLFLTNNTAATEVQIGTFTQNFGANNGKTFIFDGLNIPVNNTDNYSYRMLTPAWVTNPTTAQYVFTFYFKS